MQADHLSVTFAALADPTRRAILARLAEGEASVGELAAPFAMSLPAVSKHLGVLERARLIERRKDAQWRRCALRPDRLRAAAEWIGQYQRFWTESFDRLAEHLANLDEEDDTDGDGSTETE
ncbi:MAG TPA: metalloregulator ArsR/SmtB family transcription factor [Geminicoccaceae bacterium]|jgi:DNA-binding transcriptional ArsR family regulator|nr:metalloregulator ArsR/SmtB family transcription factor [Geminicoccaceae bacterium]